MTEQSKASCDLLFIARDLEWINAFSKGVNRFFALNYKQLEELDESKIYISKHRPDLVVVVPDQNVPSVNDVIRITKPITPRLPVLVVDKNNENLDKFLQQGADYAVARKNLLSAIRAVQQVMQFKTMVKEVLDTRQKNQDINQLYRQIYQELPDPICYLQDGIFLDANQAFLQLFEIPNKEALDELTIMNFVPKKNENKLKVLLKTALSKEIVPAEEMELASSSKERLNMSIQVSQVVFDGEKCVQLYARPLGGGLVTGRVLDPATGFADITVLRSSINQTAKRYENPKQVLGSWVYLYVQNYRELWQKDGIKPAEALMKFLAQFLEKVLPPSTEFCRFTDDGIIFWAQDEKSVVISRLETLIKRLDETVAEGVGRLIYPRLWAGVQTIRADSDLDELLSLTFRSVRRLSLSQSAERIAESVGSDELSSNDEKRLAVIKQALKDKQFTLNYQPIVCLNADGIPRYVVQLGFSGQMEIDDFDVVLQKADRYGLMRDIDRFKIEACLQAIMSHSQVIDNLHIFMPISTDALSDENFASWVKNIFAQTGVQLKNVVFEFTLDQVNHSFTFVKRFIDVIRSAGSKLAIKDIARFDEEVQKIFDMVNPDVIKLDMREIDTFEDDEEQQFMGDITKYAGDKIMLIAEYMESPAQLSRVYPYDVNYLQGDGMAHSVSDFVFDFNQPLF